MRADLPEDILEEILNLKKDRTNITDLAVLETRGKEEFDSALSQLKANGCVLEDEKGLYLSEAGLKKAESVARKHAVLENFLTNVLPLLSFSMPTLMKQSSATLSRISSSNLSSQSTVNLFSKSDTTLPASFFFVPKT
jgi:hypothetical protein